MNRRRLLVPFVGCIVLFISLGVRLLWIQIIRHGALEDRAQRQHYRILKSQAARGIITDRSGHVLAMSVEFPEPKRVYPERELACHVLGVVGADQQGLAGVEFVAEAILRGVPLQYQIGRDALGRPIATTGRGWRAGTQDRLIPPVSLALTLDRTLQYLAEQVLEQGMRETRAKRGIMVVQDPSTGELLALVNRPGFDPNQWQGDLPILSNAAVSQTFEPGSTFKLVTAAAALEERLVGWEDRFFCENGEFVVDGFTIHDHEPKGDLPFHQVMAYSSNIGMAKLGLHIGKERFYRMARAFGFGSVSSSGLPGESPEVGTTALQMVNAYAAIANGGVLMEPRILRGVQAVPTSRERPRAIRRVCSPPTCAVLTQLLEEVVETGTGTKAWVPGYRVAGKTGTAQKFDRQAGRYSPTRFLSSFCGFLPVEGPRLAIGVFIDEPQGVSWGGEVAAPLFARFATQAMQYLGVRPTSPAPHPTVASAVTTSQPARLDLP
ncbi:MAG: penicillin-binding protein 2 [Elusimicrobia bacterium]|nr:penicillin-binding protein 2 [Elusimicrobiota bacterium]